MTAEPPVAIIPEPLRLTRLGTSVRLGDGLKIAAPAEFGQAARRVRFEYLDLGHNLTPSPTGEPIHAAMLRAGGAMNSGPTGSLMVSSRIRSISALVEASSCQPVISSTGSS